MPIWSVYTITAVVAFLVILFAISYIKAAPDEALLISGIRKNPKVLIGKAGFRIPFFERKDRLNLKLIPIDVKTSSAVPTKDYININVDAVVNVKIADKPELIQLAAQNFLNRDTGYIAEVVQQVLEGNMREIIGRMSLEEMVNDRQKFSDFVREDAAPDLEKMGMEIISFNVQNFVDNNHVIENLGVDNIAKIQKNAQIAKAEADRDVKVAQAKALQESNDAQVASDTAIAIKQNELALKRAELDKNANTSKAKADAAYEIEQQEQRKTLEVTTANANIAKQEKEILLKQKEVEITEQRLEAEIKKRAEADKYATQQKADAELYERTKKAEAELAETQRKADALKYQQEQEALAIEKMAEAQKEKMLAEAEGIKAKYEAEAEGIRAKALAEAEGTLKKAEALAKMNETGEMQMKLEALKEISKVLPAIAEATAKPLSSIDSITMYGEGNVAKLTEDITKSTSQISNGLMGSLGIDLKTMVAGLLGGSLASTNNTVEE